MKKLLNALRSNKGQGTIEYALLALVLIAIMVYFITNASNNPLIQAISDAFGRVSTAVQAVPTS